MPDDMIGNEATYEEVAVVIAGLTTKGQTLARRSTGRFQQFGLELSLQEAVAQTLVHQD